MKLQINDDNLLSSTSVQVYFVKERTKGQKTHGMLIKKFNLNGQNYYRYLGLVKKTYSRIFNNALQFSQVL